ncbi:MAG: hypothetical protein QM756_06600 [Polyangiaceae bacterium]
MREALDDAITELSFYVAIREASWDRDSWRESFLEHLAHNGIRLETDPSGAYAPTVILGDGNLEHGAGCCEFVDGAPGVQEPASFSLYARPSPHAGELLGWFIFYPWVTEGSAELLHACCYAHGTLFAVGRGEFPTPSAVGEHDVIAGFAGVRRRAFPLADALSKYGFNDGDALLERAGPYLDDALGSLARAVLAAGVLPDLGLIGTAHNPLRFSYYFTPTGGELELLVRALDGSRLDEREVEARLAGKSVELWAFASSDEVGCWLLELLRGSPVQSAG